MNHVLSQGFFLKLIYLLFYRANEARSPQLGDSIEKQKDEKRQPKCQMQGIFLGPEREEGTGQASDQLWPGTHTKGQG